MSDIITEALRVLNEKFSDSDLGGSVKFVLEDEGSIIVDDNGARSGDDETDVIMSASPETFQELLGGDLDPTSAFMSGKLKIDGDMGMALKLAGML